MLVGGVDGHNVVSRIEQDVEQQEVSLDGARGDKDVLGPAVAVGVRQFGPELERAGGLTVSERGLQQPFQDGLTFFGLFEGEEIVSREGKDAALGYIVARRKLVGGHPTFQGERLDLRGGAPSFGGRRHVISSVYPHGACETLFTQRRRK